MTPAQRLKNIIGGSAGNFVEWFDWFAYASFARRPVQPPLSRALPR
jgi:hypothetical protein